MCKLIIVDDELLVRLGMKSLIESGSTEFEIAGTFANGQEALDYCINNKPDIVLTDIMMPLMDGLQFIEKLKGLYPNIKIIVLSCRNEYKVVKEAFKLGISDYILKHEIEIEDLLKVLRMMKDDLCHMDKVQLPEKNNRADKDMLISMLLNKQDDQPYPTDLNEKIKLHHLRLYPSNLIVICIEIDHEYDAQYLRIEKNIGISSVVNMINEIFSKHKTGEVLFIENMRFVGVLCFTGENSTKTINDKLYNIIEDIKISARNFFNCDLSIGISNRHNSLYDIKTACLEAYEAIMYKFYRKKSSCISYSEVCNYGALNCNQKIKDFKEVVLNKANYSFNSDGLQTTLENYLAEVETSKCLSPVKVKKEINSAVYCMCNVVQEYFGLKAEQIFDNDYVDIYKLVDQIDNIVTLKSWTSFFIKRIELMIREKGMGNPFITRVKEYIKGHYSENIGLKSISSEFHLNMNYFCQSFKKEAGINFVDYLTEVRLEKARIFLKEGKLSTSEVAEKVGFNNVNYFTKVFKKATGLSISEYKRN